MIAHAGGANGTRAAAEVEHGHAEAAWAIVLRDVTHELSGAGVAAIGGLRGPEGQAMLVLGLSAPERRAEAAGRIAASVRATAARQLGDGAALAVCVGAAAPHLERPARRADGDARRPRPPRSRPSRATGTT